MVLLHLFGNIYLNTVQNGRCAVRCNYFGSTVIKTIKITVSEKEVQVLYCYIFYKEITHNTICFKLEKELYINIYIHK